MVYQLCGIVFLCLSYKCINSKFWRMPLVGLQHVCFLLIALGVCFTTVIPETIKASCNAVNAGIYIRCHLDRRIMRKLLIVEPPKKHEHSLRRCSLEFRFIRVPIVFLCTKRLPYNLCCSPFFHYS